MRDRKKGRFGKAHADGPRRRHVRRAGETVAILGQNGSKADARPPARRLAGRRIGERVLGHDVVAEHRAVRLRTASRSRRRSSRRCRRPRT